MIITVVPFYALTVLCAFVMFLPLWSHILLLLHSGTVEIYLIQIKASPYFIRDLPKYLGPWNHPWSFLSLLARLLSLIMDSVVSVLFFGRVIKGLVRVAVSTLMCGERLKSNLAWSTVLRRTMARRGLDGLKQMVLRLVCQWTPYKSTEESRMVELIRQHQTWNDRVRITLSFHVSPDV